MSGEGADELFAGYESYGFSTNSRAVRVFAEGLKKLPKSLRFSIARGIENKHFKGQKHLYESLAPAEDFFIGQAKVFDESESVELLKEEFQAAPTVKEIVGKTYKKHQKVLNFVKCNILICTNGCQEISCLKQIKWLWHIHLNYVSHC